MTALPATRQEAELIVDRCAVRLIPDDAAREWLIHGSEAELDALIALAKRGAETVGATERWLHPDDSNMGETLLRGHRPNVPGVRRCLILPDES